MWFIPCVCSHIQLWVLRYNYSCPLSPSSWGPCLSFRYLCPGYQPGSFYAEGVYTCIIPAQPTLWAWSSLIFTYRHTCYSPSVSACCSVPPISLCSSGKYLKYIFLHPRFSWFSLCPWSSLWFFYLALLSSLSSPLSLSHPLLLPPCVPVCVSSSIFCFIYFNT